MKIRDGGEPEIKAIDFLVSGSESIELLFRSLPSLVDRGIYLNDKKGVGIDVYCGLFRSRKKRDKIGMGYSSVGVID